MELSRLTARLSLTTPAHIRPLLALRGCFMALLLLLCAVPAAFAGSTTTTLAITSGGNTVTSVTPGTPVTFKATVTASGVLVTAGSVRFCDAAYPHCTDIHMVGQAQLTSAGTASVTVRLPVGAHSYDALFVGTTGNAGSSSSTTPLTVTGPYPTTTGIGSSGSAGNYTLNAGVNAFSPLTVASPSGTVSFIDVTNASSIIATASLVANNFGPTPFLTNVSSLGNYGGPIALGDFNNDGKPDIIAFSGSPFVVGLGAGNGYTFTPVTQQSSLSITVGSDGVSNVTLADFNNDGNLDAAFETGGQEIILLGNGDGTFTKAAAFSAVGQYAFSAFGDFNGDGNLDVAVISYTGGLTILLGNGTGTFVASTPNITGLSNPSAIAIADINGDGKSDLVIDNSNGSNLLILLSNGDGTFTAKPSLSIGPSTFTLSVNIGDFNGDGNLDIAAPNQTPGTISVFLGKGDGTFTTAASPSAGTSPQALLMGDFNLDGKLDFAVIAGNVNVTGITLLLGNGDGTFSTSALALSYGGASSTVTFAAADLNGDGGTDLIIKESSGSLLSLTRSSSASVTGVSPIGTGTHQIKVTYPGDSNYGGSAPTITVPLTAQQVATTISLTALPTTSMYGQQVVLSATLSPYTAQSQTTNGETVTFYNGSTMLGTGTLSSGVATLNITTLPVGTDSIKAVYGGDTNFVTSTSSIVSYAVTKATQVASVTTLSIMAGGTAVTTITSGLVTTLTATVTANGAPVTKGTVNFCDSTATYCTDSHLLGPAQITSSGTAVLRLVPSIGGHSYKAVFVGTSAYSTSSSSTSTLGVSGTYPTTTTLASSGSKGNYTLTGTTSSISSAAPSGSISFSDNTNSNYLLGTGSLKSLGDAFSLTAGSPIASGSDVQSIMLADFNGDGFLDAALLTYNPTTSTNALTIILGRGDGTFATALSPITISSFFRMAVGDVNNDGIPDIVISNTQGGLSLLIGKGDGTFAPAVSVGSGYAIGVAVADVNGDGNADILECNESGYVTVFLGRGDGTFQTGINTSAISSPSDIIVRDFNGDGSLDIAVLNSNASAVSILLGNGDGTFRTGSTVTLPVDPRLAGDSSFPISIAAGDLNGDGVPDLAIVAYYNTSVILGRGDGTFGTPSTFASGSVDSGLSIADLNNDGTLDLAVSDNGGRTLQLFFGNGDGTFKQTVVPVTAAGPLAAGDLNSDGIPDLLLGAGFTTNGATPYLSQNLFSSSFAVSGISPTGTGQHSVQASYSGATNYSPSQSSAMNILASPVTTSLTVSAVPNTSTYGQQVVLSATLTPYTSQNQTTNSESVAFYAGSNLLGTGTLSGGVATLNTTTLPVGNDSIYAVYSGDTNFVNSQSQSAPFTVSPITPTITFSVPTHTFGDAAFAVAATSNSPGAFTYSLISGPATVSGSTVTLTGAGTVILQASEAASGNYAAGSQTATFTVNKAVPTITWATPAAITYGTALSGTQLNATASTPGGFSYAPGASTVPSAGTLLITATFTPFDSTDYTTATAQVTLTINKAQLTVAAANATRLYGSANPNFTGTLSGVVNSDPITASYSSTATVTSSVGSFPITATLADPSNKLSNYTVVNTPGTLTITPAPLTVTVANATRLYGSSNPTFSGTISGLVNSDPITATYSSTATATSSVGTFPITAALADPSSKLSNYTVVNTPGTLTVTPAPLTVAVASATRLYGSANPTFTGTISGLVNGDPVTATYSSAATVTSSVGTFPITATLADPSGKLGNYTLVNTPGTLTITPAPLVETVASASRVYGGSNPTFSGTLTGLLNGDPITPSYASAAVATSSVGMYPITASLADPSGRLPNYTVTNTPGSLTVTPATLTLTIASASRTYGAANPTFTGTLTGLVNSDPITATYSSTATVASNVGNYPITATFADPSNKLTNYTVPTNTGTLTITQAPLVITVASATRVFGTANPTFTGTVTGLLNGDPITASYATTATTTSAVGTYPITASLADPSAKLANYSVTNTAGTLTVSKAGSTLSLAGPASAAVGSSVTFTATAGSATSGTPTGTVTFLSGTTALGTGTLSNGVASFTTSAIPLGTASITASYAGDTNFNSSTSTASSIIIGTPDYTITVAPPSATINAGQSATFVFTITPLFGYNQPISFACGGLPANATCTFTPNPVTPNGAPVTSTLVITTDVKSAALVAPAFGFHTGGAVALAGLLLLPFLRRRKLGGLSLTTLLLFLTLGGAITALSGCGSSNNTPKTPDGTYTVTVNATAGTGSTSHSASISVVVNN